MKNKIVFIADYYKDDLLGGAESNNMVLIEHLRAIGYEVEKRRSNTCTLNSDEFYIIANFVGLSEEKKLYLHTQCKYLLIEHDHKYIKARDPSRYKDFVIPKDQIINKEFYKGALTVVVLSLVCKDVIESALGLCNVHSIGTSLWSTKKFDHIKEKSKNKKTLSYGILDSSNMIKGKSQSVKWCKDNDKEYGFIGNKNESDFIEQLSKVEKLVFMPQVLETFSRLAVEAKMLGCKLVTKKKLLGFASETCYELSGEELQDEMRLRVKLALNTFEELIKRNKK